MSNVYNSVIGYQIRKKDQEIDSKFSANLEHYCYTKLQLYTVKPVLETTVQGTKKCGLLREVIS